MRSGKHSKAETCEGKRDRAILRVLPYHGLQHEVFKPAKSLTFLGSLNQINTS